MTKSGCQWMSIRVALHHRTAYRFDRPVEVFPHVVRLRPAPHCRTEILAYSLKVEPATHFLNWQQDPFGNFQARLVFPKRVRSFEIEVDLVADLSSINPFDFFLDENAETWPFQYDSSLETELAPFRRRLEPGPLLAALIDDARSGRLEGRQVAFWNTYNSNPLPEISEAPIDTALLPGEFLRYFDRGLSMGRGKP